MRQLITDTETTGVGPQFGFKNIVIFAISYYFACNDNSYGQPYNTNYFVYIILMSYKWCTKNP